jgi:hypothetical protein
MRVATGAAHLELHVEQALGAKDEQRAALDVET